MSSDVFPPVLPDSQPRQSEAADQLDVAINALQQRELLEPVLLLSAGYLAVPFFLGQLRLLLTPLLLLLGVSLPKKGRRHELPS